MTTGQSKSNKALVAIIAAAVAVLLVSIFAYSYFGTATPSTVGQQKAPVPRSNQQKVPQQQPQAEQQQNAAPPKPQQAAEIQAPPLQAEANRIMAALPMFNQLNASTIDNSIEFTIKLNSTLLERGQTILAEITARNLLPKVVYVPAESNWAPGIRHPTCHWWVSVEIFRGYYTKSNISSATPLQMLNPVLPFMCPPADVYKDFYIERARDGSINVIYLVLEPESEKIDSFYASGYYVKSSCYENPRPYCDLVPFTTGVYTVAAGAGWGQILFLYFTVK